MNIVIVLIILFIICFILFMWFMGAYNNYQAYIIRINEAENFIDTTLRKRFDLLNKSVSIIKVHKKDKKDVLESIINLKSKKLSNFDLDRKLYEAINEFNKIKEEYPELANSENFLKIDLGLFESEAEIVAARKYYNDIITDYNKLTRTFPTNIVGKICKFKERTYFDGKDMNDDIINDFKL